MDKAQCIVSIASVYSESSEKSEMLTQLLYGEKVEILETNKNWYKIVTDYDGIEGWVFNTQIDKTIYQNAFTLKDKFSFVETIHGTMLLSLGSKVSEQSDNNDSVGQSALEFLNVPFLQGGRSFFGTDADGFVQLVYKKHDIKIPRKAIHQADLGEVLNFIEESKEGDLAFFDDENGNILHVGIMLEDQKIIHMYGKVRIDILDSSGIFNIELNKHTHKLRFIKRLLP